MAEPRHQLELGRPQVHIYWVDDEPQLAGALREAVEEAFERRHVSVHHTVRSCLDALDTDLRDRGGLLLPVLIWDMMLPTEPGMDPAEAAYGTRTGRILFAEFRRRCPDAPTILLTHVADYRLLEEFGRGAHQRAWLKSDVTPAQLAGWIREMARARWPGVDRPGG